MVYIELFPRCSLEVSADLKVRNKRSVVMKNLINRASTKTITQLYFFYKDLRWKMIFQVMLIAYYRISRGLIMEWLNVIVFALRDAHLVAN